MSLAFQRLSVFAAEDSLAPALELLLLLLLVSQPPGTTIMLRIASMGIASMGDTTGMFYNFTTKCRNVQEK